MSQKTKQAVELPEPKLRFWLRMAWVVAYALMLVSMLNNLARLNTDAIAYMRVAEYWSVGNLGFAVNGYWGPLLSWLMVPFLWLGVEPLLAGKLAMLISGAVFFHGSLFLVRSVGLRSIDELIVAWVLALTIPGWMSNHVTPDLLVAGLMAFALGQAVSRDWLANRRRAFGTGATWGLAYLAKAVALPVGVVVSVLLALCWRLGQAENRQAAWRQLGVALGLLALVAAPWITVLSLKYDKPTFSTSGPIAHAIVGPGNDRPAPHPFGSTIYQPEPGRVTAWEDPSRMGYDYWSPFASGENFSHQLSLIGRNAKTVFQFLAVFDGIGALLGWFGVGTLVFGLALFAKRPWAKNWLADRWRWMVIPLICLGGIYLPVYVMPVDLRYFYLFLPLIMILTLGLVSQFFANNWLTGFVLSSLFLLPLLWRSPSRSPVGSFAQDLAKRMESAGKVGPIVGSTFVSSEGHRLGLYVAWHLGQPWFGDVRPASLEAYKHSGARFAIAIGGSPLAKQLDADPAFKHVSAKLGEKGSLQVYEVQASQP
ncbi:MAG: hypothetical protein QF920_00380 [Verrucomicrobiota bacterium]|nr:hypothetical protein [Verrucomicrobiota bacterium]